MADPQRQADLAKIHLAKRELNLDETGYRALLREVTGQESAAGLDSLARRKLLTHLRNLGFTVRRMPALATPGQCRMIRGLWLDLQRVGLIRDSGQQALDRYIQLMTGAPTLGRLRRLPAVKLIEALKQWRRRKTPRESAKPFNESDN